MNQHLYLKNNLIFKFLKKKTMLSSWTKIQRVFYILKILKESIILLELTKQ